MQAPEYSPIRILPAEPYPHPLRPIPPVDWTKTRVEELWKHIVSLQDYLDDHQKRGRDEFEMLLRSGECRSYEVGQNDGIILVYNIRLGLSGTVEAFFWGDRRRFVDQFGSLAEVRYVALRHLFDEAGVRCLRVRLDPNNAGGVRFATRCKFRHEGTLRADRVVNKKACDVKIMGLLSAENEE